MLTQLRAFEDGLSARYQADIHKCDALAANRCLLRATTTGEHRLLETEFQLGGRSDYLHRFDGRGSRTFSTEQELGLGQSLLDIPLSSLIAGS
jgi:hypothetical protein